MLCKNAQINEKLSFGFTGETEEVMCIILECKKNFLKQNKVNLFIYNANTHIININMIQIIIHYISFLF